MQGSSVAVEGETPGRGPTSSALHALIDASQEARAAAKWILARSTLLCEKSMVVQQRSLEVRLASRPSSHYARVEGTVDGKKCVAVVHRDGTVVGERALLRRVEIVVALGETFGDGRATASIGCDPLASTLSAARAYDSVRFVDVFGARGGTDARRGAVRSSTAPVHAPTPLDAPATPLDAPGSPLTVAVEQGPSGVVLRVEGELDVGSADDFATLLDRHCTGSCDVTVDLSGVTFVDATGVSVLVSARRTLAARGRTLHLRGARGAVHRTLDICALGELTRDTGD